MPAPPIDVRIIGARELQRKFLRLTGPAQKKLVRAALREVAKPLAADMRAAAPIRTGALRRSIKVRAPKRRGRAGREELSIAIVTDVPYAAHVELGTHGRAPVPFMRRTVDRRRSGAIRGIGDAIGRGLERLAKR